MFKINLPYHLIIPAMISALVLTYKRKTLFKVGNWKWYWISFTVFLLSYLFLIGGATYSSITSEIALQKYDLNDDGFFNGNEITSDQKLALTKVTADTGRNFVIITGLVFSAIIGLIVFAIGKIIEYYKFKKKARL